MKPFEDIQAIVTDIEGTTSSISFVHDVLFPYAQKHLPEFVRMHEAEVENILEQVREHESRPDLTTEQIIQVFLGWIAGDQKITPLKTLQGMIWQAGYEAGELKGHLYDDLKPALQAWYDSGIKLYVYSSGSIAAQKLLFSYTEQGDLTPLFSGYFDTTTGPKKEVDSYKKIVTETGFPAQNILFLSDHAEEISAASKAGMQVLTVDREDPSTTQAGGFVISTFDEIHLHKAAA